MHLIRAIWALAGLTYYLPFTFDTPLQSWDHDADLFSSLLMGVLVRARLCQESRYRFCKVRRTSDSCFKKHNCLSMSPTQVVCCLFVFSVHHLPFLLLSCFSSPLWFCFIFSMVPTYSSSGVISVTETWGRNAIWELAVLTCSLGTICLIRYFTYFFA